MTNRELLEAIVAFRTRRPPMGYAPLLLLVVSAGLFVGMGVLQWELRAVVIFLVAVFVHELGHVLAMKLFHFKNLKMLFIPLVGGMARGDPDDLDAGKSAAVLLAGPVMGLLGGTAAAGLLAVTDQPDLVTFAWISLYLNVFNLMPLVPLDGGHFVSELLFSRHPRAEFRFKIVTLILLTTIILLSKFYILCAVIALMLTTLRSDYRMATGISDLRKDPRMAGGALTEEKVALVKAMIGRANPGALAEKKQAALPALIWDAWIGAKKLFPPPRIRAALFAAYGVMIFGAAPALWAFIRHVTG